MSGYVTLSVSVAHFLILYTGILVISKTVLHTSYIPPHRTLGTGCQNCQPSAWNCGAYLESSSACPQLAQRLGSLER